MCTEEHPVKVVNARSNLLLYAAYVQRSTVLAQKRGEGTWPPLPMSKSDFLPADLLVGPHVSTCGHTIHASCWQNLHKSETDANEAE